jgi:putative tricarboxylic transport membrane protein
MEWIGPVSGNIFAPINLLVMIAGVAGGILVGALPGLTGTMAIALLVPFTYGMTPESALIMLGGVYVGAMYGGSIAAILINTPGAPASIATTLDGHPMAQKGQAEEALAASATSSGIGGILGTIVLLLFSPLLAALSLKFGSPEYFWLGILGLTIIAGLSAKTLTKGIIGGLFGVLISTIGMSPSTGVSRLTFGISDLLGGVEIIVALIGLFCIPQIMNMAEQGADAGTLASFTPSKGKSIKIMLQVLRRWGNLIRSTIIGVIVGIIPGAGGNVAGLLSYQEASRAAKNKEEFGHGALDGVIASETANNAEVEGSLIPLLTLGIPGAPQAAVLLGALLLQGLRPGPELFSGYGATITYTFILSLFLANITMFVLGFFGSRFYARALNLPLYLLMPVVLSLSVVGSFAGRNSPLDVFLMLGLGLLAYAGTKVAIAPAPIALGVILGPIIERGLVESMMLSRASGSLMKLFFTRPISIILIVLTLGSVCWPFYMTYREKKKLRARGKDVKEAVPIPAAKKAPPAGAQAEWVSNIWIGCVTAVVAAVALLKLQGVDLQSAVLPRVCALLMIVFAIVILTRGIRLKASGQIQKPEGTPKMEVFHVAGSALLAVVYVSLIPAAGFFVTTFLVFCSISFLLVPKQPFRRKFSIIIGMALAVCIAYYIIFQNIFNVPFPTGFLI